MLLVASVPSCPSSGSSPPELVQNHSGHRLNGFLVFLQLSNGSLQKTKIQHASILDGVEGWNSTKLAPLVLICVVSLAMISSIGLALAPSVNQMMKTAFSRGNTEDEQSPNDLTLIIHLLGDPINDPKPNSLPNPRASSAKG